MVFGAGFRLLYTASTNISVVQGPVFEPFAKIGLLFTQNLDRIRTAYKNAGVAEGLWEAA